MFSKSLIRFPQITLGCHPRKKFLFVSGLILQQSLFLVPLKLCLSLCCGKWLKTNDNLASSLTLFRMSFLGAALSHISYNDETRHWYTSPKEDPKEIWVTWHTPWVLLTSGFFHRKSTYFDISRNTDIDCILIDNF